MHTQNRLKNLFSIQKKVGATIALLSLTCLTMSRPAEATSKPTAIYSGVATTTVLFPNVYGNYGSPETFQTNVVITVGTPEQAGGLTERNPFNLKFGPPTNSSPIGDPGAISVVSASEVNGGSGGFLLQYWSYKQTNPLTYTGTLGDTHAAESVTANLVNFPYEVAPNITLGAFPYGMGVGTQLGVQFSSDFSQIHIVVSGKSIDNFRLFESNIIAKRIQ